MKSAWEVLRSPQRLRQQRGKTFSNHSSLKHPPLHKTALSEMNSIKSELFNCEAKNISGSEREVLNKFRSTWVGLCAMRTTSCWLNFATDERFLNLIQFSGRDFKQIQLSESNRAARLPAIKRFSWFGESHTDLSLAEEMSIRYV